MPRTGLLFASGSGFGTLGTLIGAGGGWMIVPLLLFGLGFSPQQAVGTSLAVVFLGMGLSFLVGVISSFFGVGGGSCMFPS